MAASMKQLFLKTCPMFLTRPAQSVHHKLSAVGRRLDMLFFPRKTKWLCPCCGLKYRSFIAGNHRKNSGKFDPSRYENVRQDILCPVCLSFPRHRMLALWLERHMDLLRDARILYFAPGKSETLWLRRRKVSCTTADLYGEADLKLDIQATGLPDGSWDVIVCNHVLEHVDDFRKAVKEMFRILRPGGSFICSFPMDPGIELVDEDASLQTEEARIRRFGQFDHKRVFGMKADRFLTEAGFAVEKLCGADFPEEILPVVGPANYDMNILFRCVKGSGPDAEKTS